MAEALGVNIKFIHAVVFAAGVALATVAGMIAAPISSVYPDMGSQVLIMCFVVVVIGGIGSVRGALISALLVGLVDTFGKVLLPQAAGMLVYMLMAACCCGSPKACSRPADDARPRISPLPSSLPRFVALARCSPSSASEFCARWSTQMMILAIFAMSLELLRASPAWCARPRGVLRPGAYAPPCSRRRARPASLLAAAAGLRRWPPAPTRSRSACCRAHHGIYFIMVTMAFAQMVYYLFLDNKARRRHRRHLPQLQAGARIGGLEAARPRQRARLLLLHAGLLLACTPSSRVLLVSPFGRVLAGIRVNEHRMRAMGFGTFGYKLAAFTLAGALAGLAGFLLARARTASSTPSSWACTVSAMLIMMVILGGIGNLRGAIVGAFAFALLQDCSSRRRSSALRQALAAVAGPDVSFIVALLPGLIGIGQVRSLLGACSEPASAAPREGAQPMSERRRSG